MATVMRFSGVFLLFLMGVILFVLGNVARTGGGEEASWAFATLSVCSFAIGAIVMVLGGEETAALLRAIFKEVLIASILLGIAALVLLDALLALLTFTDGIVHIPLTSLHYALAPTIRILFGFALVGACIGTVVALIFATQAIRKLKVPA